MGVQALRAAIGSRQSAVICRGRRRGP